MELGLKGKVAAVTGATEGIGKIKSGQHERNRARAGICRAQQARTRALGQGHQVGGIKPE